MDEIPDSLSPESSSASLDSPSIENDSSPISPSSPSTSSSSSGSTQHSPNRDGSSSSGDSQPDNLSVNLPGFHSVTAAVFGVPDITLPSIQDLGLFQAHHHQLAHPSSPISDQTLDSSTDLIPTGDEGEDDEDLTDAYDDEGFDEDGYDEAGFDEDGFDREGYDEEGYDEEGYDRQGNPDLDHIRRPRALPIGDLEHFNHYQWLQDMAEWLSPSNQDLTDQDNMDVVDDSQYEGSSVFERSSSLFVGDDDNDMATTTNDNGRAGLNYSTRGSQANLHRFQRSPVGSEYPHITGALDELVEIDMVRGRRNRETQTRQRDNPSAAPSNSAGVIDLTGDDDDGDEVPLRRVLDQSQNARRRQSQQRNAPPQFSRTDDSYIGDGTVIDLISSDSDGEQPTTNNANSSHARANQDHHHHHHHHHHHRHHRHQPPRPTEPRHSGARHASRPSASGSIFNLFTGRGPEAGLFRFFNHFNGINGMAGRPQPVEEDISLIGAHPVNGGVRMQMPLEMHLDYNRMPFPHPPAARPATPKPQHEPPPAARDGFTRDTGKEDVAYVCAGCNEELAVDPDAAPETSPTSSKKPRSKKDKEEHHFWAVKACGHVFCKRCYDNRRPPAKQLAKAHFRVVKPTTGKGTSKIYCPVEGCDSDVTNKTAWVGLFM